MHPRVKYVGNPEGNYDKAWQSASKSDVLKRLESEMLGDWDDSLGKHKLISRKVEWFEYDGKMHQIRKEKM